MRGSSGRKDEDVRHAIKEGTIPTDDILGKGQPLVEIKKGKKEIHLYVDLDRDGTPDEEWHWNDGRKIRRIIERGDVKERYQFNDDVWYRDE